MPKLYFMRKKFVAESSKRIKERIAKGLNDTDINKRKDFFYYVRAVSASWSYTLTDLAVECSQPR